MLSKVCLSSQEKVAEDGREIVSGFVEETRLHSGAFPFPGSMQAEQLSQPESPFLDATQYPYKAASFMGASPSPTASYATATSSSPSSLDAAERLFSRLFQGHAEESTLSTERLLVDE